MAGPFLSIVIPAYNEERRLPRTLEQVTEFFSRQSYTGEVVVVENGSRDRTLEIARELARQHENVRVFREVGRGKGLAVRRGMLEALGEYRFICDADLSMPIDEVNAFLPPVLEDFDVAIGSREAHGSVRYDEPAYRHWGGRLINAAIRFLVLPGLQDTQCGFKCFTAAAAADLFSRQTMDGWSFDIEILYMARRRKYRIREVPIHWYFDPETKLEAFRDGVHMLRDILMVRLNALRGVYDRNA